MTDGETNEGDTPRTEDDSTKTLFDRTNEATARLEEANKKQEELLNRNEELYAKQKLGGNSMGGQNQVIPKTEEQRKSKQAEIFFGGTALGDDIRKANE